MRSPVTVTKKKKTFTHLSLILTRMPLWGSNKHAHTTRTTMINPPPPPPSLPPSRKAASSRLLAHIWLKRSQNSRTITISTRGDVSGCQIMLWIQIASDALELHLAHSRAPAIHIMQRDQMMIISFWVTIHIHRGSTVVSCCCCCCCWLPAETEM